MSFFLPAPIPLLHTAGAAGAAAGALPPELGESLGDNDKDDKMGGRGEGCLGIEDGRKGSSKRSNSLNMPEPIHLSI